MKAAPRLLIALPQLPFDPASGAARTATTVGEFLADAGFEVASISTTSSEASSVVDIFALLKVLSIDPERYCDSDCEVIRFSRRRVQHTLLDTRTCSIGRWESEHGAHYDRLFAEMLLSFRPNVVMTYGGSIGDLARQRRACRFRAIQRLLLVVCVLRSR